MSGTYEYSMRAMAGGSASRVAVSSTSAQSIILGDFPSVVVTPTVDVFLRRSASPVAVADGTDQILLGGSSYRLTGFTGQDRLAFITGGTSGFVYLTPFA